VISNEGLEALRHQEKSLMRTLSADNARMNAR